MPVKATRKEKRQVLLLALSKPIKNKLIAAGFTVMLDVVHKDEDKAAEYLSREFKFFFPNTPHMYLDVDFSADRAKGEVKWENVSCSVYLIISTGYAYLPHIKTMEQLLTLKESLFNNLAN